MWHGSLPRSDEIQCFRSPMAVDRINSIWILFTVFCSSSEESEKGSSKIFRQTNKQQSGGEIVTKCTRLIIELPYTHVDTSC